MAARYKGRNVNANTVKDIYNAKRRLIRFLQKQQTVPFHVLLQEEMRVEQEAKAKTPYKTGALEESVTVYLANYSSTKSGIVLYADAVSPSGVHYAYVQHESEYFKHPIKGQAHYISEPFAAAVARIKKRMKEEITP